MQRFVKNEHIETRTIELIKNYERKANTTVSYPIPLENILMQEYNLFVHWDEINEEDGIEIYGGLCSEKKTIVLNQKHQKFFNSTKGFERSTIAHEAGHWEYDVDKFRLGNEPDLGFTNKQSNYYRSSTKDSIVHIYKGNLKIPDVPRLLEMMKKYDTPDQARIVNRFSASLNMPYYLIKEYINKHDIYNWKNLYEMRDEFDVSISALTVRLQQLKILYIKDNEIFKNKADYSGQFGLEM